MARIAGVNIPDNKHAVISLTYIFGVGRTQARKLCATTGVAEDTKIGELTEQEMDALRTSVGDLSVEGD
jgi:small subunit ribosomal protein S13